MTIVGEAELDVRAVGGRFTADVNKVVKPGMASVGAEAEHAAGRGGRAFKLMFSSIAQNSAGAFAPVIETLDHIEGVAEDIRKKGNLGVRVTAVGAAGVGVGAGLQAFASQEQAAQQQLADSIQNTGHVYEEYGDEIEKTVKHGERFAVMGYQTMDVLNRLTLATNDPKKALQDYQVVLDMAAARHMSVTRAAQMLASAYGGNTRVFRMFGLNVADQNKLLSAAEKADKAAATSADKLKTARQNLADVEARIGAARKGHVASAAQVASAEASVATATAAAQVAEFKHGAASPQYEAARARVAAAEQRLTAVQAQGGQVTQLTVSQEIELRKAHDAVTEATKNAKSATEAKTQADAAAKGAAHGVDAAVAQLSTRLSGQGAAAVNTWTGHLKVLGAELEDNAARLGSKYGPAITAVSSGITALGAGLTLTTAVMNRFRGASAATAVAENATAVGATRAATAIEAEGAAAASAAGEITALGAAGAGAVGILAGLKGLPLYGVGAMPDQKPRPNVGLPEKVALSQREFTGIMALPKEQRQQAITAYTTGVGAGLHPDAGKLAAWRATWDPKLGVAPAAPAGVDSQLAGLLMPHLNSLHMTLLQIQHNTAKTSQHTDDTHRAVRQHNGTTRIGRSPELASL